MTSKREENAEMFPLMWKSALRSLGHSLLPFSHYFHSTKVRFGHFND